MYKIIFTCIGMLVFVACEDKKVNTHYGESAGLSTSTTEMIAKYRSECSMGISASCVRLGLLTPTKDTHTYSATKMGTDNASILDSETRMFKDRTLKQ